MPVEIKVPVLGESVTEATVARWLKQPGDTVAADEALVELETDKVTLEVNAPSAGVMGELTAQEGTTVNVGALLAMLNEGGGAAAKPAQAKTETKTETAKLAPPVMPKPDPAPAAAKLSDSGPAVRKLVEEAKPDMTGVAPSGKDGRFTKGDVLAAVAKPPRVPGPREERVRMTRLRQRIAERLKEAQNTAAMLTTFNEVDMTAILALRAEYKDAFEKKHGVKLGFMSFFVKASITALKEFPAVNAEIDGADIVYKNYYDIGVAVSTPTGLVVPVVKDCDGKSFAEIEKAIAEMGGRARDGKLALEELSGGTFTITNGGVFGSMMSTPILNPPQAGILGMHKTMERPIAVNGKVEIRPMMYLALSYDHRLVDGREAVSFLVRVKEAIENPMKLLQRALLDL